MLTKGPLSPVKLHRLMQKYKLTTKDLSRLTGYPLTHVKTWIHGVQSPPLFLQTVIENQDKYKELLPREFRGLVSQRGRRKQFQRPLPKIGE